MCPEEYGVMAKSGENLENHIMVSTSDGYITIKDEPMVEENNDDNDNHLEAELIKTQSEVHLSEQNKKRRQINDRNNDLRSKY